MAKWQIGTSRMWHRRNIPSGKEMVLLGLATTHFWWLSCSTCATCGTNSSLDRKAKGLVLRMSKPLGEVIFFFFFLNFCNTNTFNGAVKQPTCNLVGNSKLVQQQHIAALSLQPGVQGVVRPEVFSRVQRSNSPLLDGLKKPLHFIVVNFGVPVRKHTFCQWALQLATQSCAICCQDCCAYGKIK